MRLVPIAGVLITIVVAGVTVLWWRSSDQGTATAALAQPADADLVAGATLYAENCAGCHGANLEGQANWQTPGADGLLPAPPHDVTGHTWHHPDSMLFAYTKRGGAAVLAEMGIEFKSGMTGFGDQLSDSEIWNILAFLKSQWPERQRQAQAERTNADIGAQQER
jgi:mono/diheme cytochrome c family protein